MPKTRRPAVSKRIWMTVAVLGTGALHTYVLDRLLNLKPQPTDQPERRTIAILPEEWVYEFAPESLPAVPVNTPVQLPVSTKPRVANAVKQIKPAVVDEAVIEHVATEYGSPTPSAADLLQQIPGAASQTLSKLENQRKPWLDLGVKADRADAAIEPERRTAGFGGAPTRTGMAPVGDLANGLLIERWQQIHHDSGNRDCTRRPQGEPIAVYLGRCKQGL